MTYIWKYKTPEGFDDMLMNSDGEYLTGLWFEGSDDEKKHKPDADEKRLTIFEMTEKWLDDYFYGKPSPDIPNIKIEKLTSFRRDVSEIMKKIPFGETTTYGEIAKMIAVKRGISKMSAQAVGGAVGWNPICIIIPCHRVIGSDGSLTGYGGGIRNKELLLLHERKYSL
ncbi:methylated-DNA--[protein]-cysteine S-methyltransferase [Butyrivibrio sp. AE3004]|uniref:methylated-DNA--[protein]-cysteine S-methyltransferase n=1 Tax=Butyrivibrio sp. AE3004 TaxID=1506994 RepID=UPI0004947610|nr:methylated-DNA--[protein]-cysteine S-methyltransferase [Butyrivibrio sp. AE3004]